jgi:diguanylate cyclase (GGDEF)-like protein/PAS domain S-box-containing protein
VTAQLHNATRSAGSSDAARQVPAWPGPITAVTAGYAIAYLWWERSGLGSPGLRDLLGTVGFMPLNLACVVLNGLAARNPVLDPAVRQALRFLTIGCLCVLLGNTVSVYYLTALGSNPPVSWADPFYLADSLLILAALLSFPLTRRTRLERWKFALDAAMVLLGGGVAIWYYSVRPTWGAEGGSIVVNVLAFAYPLVSLLLLLGITTVLLRGPLDGNRRAFRLLVAGVVVSIVADLTFDLVLLQTGGRSAGLTDAVYLLTYLLLIASAEYYYRYPIPASTAAAEQRPRTQPVSPLPYLALATAYGLLVAAVLRPWTDPVSGLAIGALCITALVVARQVLAVRENVRLLAETAARQNEVRFRSLVQHSSDVIIVIRPDGAIRFVSPSVSRVLGYEPETLSERSLFELLHTDDRDRARSFCREAGQLGGVTAPVEWRFRQPEGSVLHAEIIATNLLDEPAVRGIVLNTRDVSERKRLEQQLLHQAFHDPLTGLANRALFRDRVSHALTLARRHGHAITVLFLDLDDFKKVNDSLGHAEGDRLLVAAAERFRSCARATDTIARLGGDEFAILVEDSPGPDGHAAMVDRLTAAMAQPFMLGGTEVQVNASIGVAATSGGESADDLLRNADVAMYTAKRRGKGRSETYQAHMYTDIRERLELESALRIGIESDQLLLHYQPIVCLRTGAVRGVEALVRWDHPRQGLLLPDQFVTLAEETGLIVTLGAWVLRAACAQLATWRAAHPELDLSMAVNISGRQLQERDIVEATRRAVTTSGVDPRAVVLEITESVLMQQTAGAPDRLLELKALGVQLAIDDFGTGYSSLGYLRRFPIDILKIAKPFVDDVGQGADRSAIARAIVGLSETLKLRTIAEGVELAEQRSTLLDLGCELGQGHYFAPPMPAAGLEEILARPARAVA